MPNARVVPPLDEDPTICAKCNLTFPTFEAYHRHKLRSRRHITCDVCSADFESHEACKQHHDLVSSSLLPPARSNASEMHSAEQDLDCPGCGKHFTRVGGLMGHIELNECKGLDKEQLEKARKQKQEW